jgi:hypothetical protein
LRSEDWLLASSTTPHSCSQVLACNGNPSSLNSERNPSEKVFHISSLQKRKKKSLESKKIRSLMEASSIFLTGVPGATPGPDRESRP